MTKIFVDEGTEILFQDKNGKWLRLDGIVTALSASTGSLMNFAETTDAVVSTLRNFSASMTLYRAPQTRRQARLERRRFQDLFEPGQRERRSAMHSAYRHRKRGGR